MGLVLAFPIASRMSTMKIDASKILKIERIPGTRLAKRIFCIECNEKIFEVSDDPTQAEVDREQLGAAAHLEFRHGLEVTTVKCDDPGCLGNH